MRIWEMIRNWFKPATLSLGAEGEALAATYYQKRGAMLLARNWRSGRDELDLVVLEGAVVVFVEVKTRTAEQAGAGWFAVDQRKRRALRRVVRAWIQRVGGVPHIRFDVVEVLVCHGVKPRIVHHLGAPLFWRRRH
jgi:putative endonuclease